MKVAELDYFDCAANKPPLIGLYVCKVASESSIDLRAGFVYVWGEWTGERFDFGKRWHLKSDDEIAVLGWAFHPEHSRMQDAPLVRTD